MATWSRQTALTAEHIINVVFNGGSKIYFVGDAGGFGSRPLYSGQLDVYEYDLTTDTETQIMNGASFSTLVGIAWFDGDLYFIDYFAEQPNFPDTHHVIAVYRWDGSLDSMTAVHTVVDIDGDYTSFSLIRLYGSSTHLVAIAANDPNFGIQVQEVHSTSGGSWGAGSFPFTILNTVASGGRYTYDAAFPDGIYEFLRDNADGAWKAVKFAGSGFGSYQASLPAETGSMFYTDPSGSIHWTTYIDATYYLNEAMSAAAESSPAGISAVLQINMPYSCGLVVPGTGGMDLYTTANGAWSFLENVQQVAIGPSFGIGSTWIVRINNDDVFIVGRNATTSDSEVWKRSEALPDPTSVAQFYYGQNTPIYRSDLPFGGVNPGTMAINPAGNVAVLGSNEAGGQIAVYGGSPFTAWTDMSDGMITGTPVTSVKYV